MAAAAASVALLQVATVAAACPAASLKAGASELRRCSYSVSARRSAVPVTRRRLSVACEAEKKREEPHGAHGAHGASGATLSKVQEVISKQLVVDVKTIAPEAKFADLGADSLDTVEIMMALEESFDITLTEESSEKISTVQDAANLIESMVAKK